MVKRYDEHPLGELSDEQLDQILDNYISSYSAENHKNIVRKTKLKKKEPIVRVTFTKHKLLLVAVLLLFFIPVGTYVAAKLWEVTVDKQGYELTTKIDKPANQQPDTGYYRLVAEYVPEYFTVDEDPYTLSFYEDLGLDEEDEENWEALSNARSISFQLYELKEEDTVIDEYVKDYKELKLSNRSAYIFKQTDQFGNVTSSIARMFFEKQNRFIDMEYFGKISEKEIKKILDNLHLINVATIEEATFAAEYMNLEEWAEMVTEDNGGMNQEPWVLDVNNKNEVAQLNEPMISIDASGAPWCEYTVKRVTFTDKIPSEILPILKEGEKIGMYPDPSNALWDEDGKLLPFTAIRYSRGDGIEKVSEKVEEVQIKPQYLEIEVTLKNVSEKTDKYAFYAPLERLAKQENGFTNLPFDSFLVRETPSSKVSPYEELKEFYEPVPTSVEEVKGEETLEEELPLAPGETKTVTAGYILASENYDSLFLNFRQIGFPKNRFIQLTQ